MENQFSDEDIKCKIYNKATLSLYLNGTWRRVGNEYDGIVWLSEDIPKPSREEFDKEVQRLQQEWEAKEYQRLRGPKYPNLTVLADALYWSSKGDNSHLEAYYASCEKIKNEYPKPSS